MVQLTIEQATAIANMLGTLPANQCYNELTVLLQAISNYNAKKKEEQEGDRDFNRAIELSKK